MDITTLAAANAYTDKKVVEGGGSGGGGLPVVEITTFPTDLNTPVFLTETENAAMTAILSSNTEQAFIKLIRNDLPLIVPITAAVVEGAPSYCGAFSMVHLIFLKDPEQDVWFILKLQLA